MKKEFFISSFLALFFLFLDSQLGLVYRFLLPNDLVANSYSLLVFLILLAYYYGDITPLVCIVLLGIFYDFIHLSSLGIGMFAFPILFILMQKIFTYIRLTIVNLSLIMVIMVFLCEVLLFSLGHFFQMISFSVSYFTVNILGPSLLLNLLTAMLLYPLLKAVFQRNRHLIVTNV